MFARSVTFNAGRRLALGLLRVFFWRLYMYACELPRKYKKYTNKEFLEHDFNEYLKQGKAKKIPGSMSNLYFIQPDCPD
ncbi:hypothetical protein BFL40_14180 [Pseudomonas costantinii]|uniref:Uncharacterized protein n=2 Tax=Pseudomonas costantinii TaxID=168469 RepID=A0A1S2V0M6_9PSED|nr:hypothetical protein BFL40_14180 [Pseudomonas costantinii]